MVASWLYRHFRIVSPAGIISFSLRCILPSKMEPWQPEIDVRSFARNDRHPRSPDILPLRRCFFTISRVQAGRSLRSQGPRPSLKATAWWHLFSLWNSATNRDKRKKRTMVKKNKNKNKPTNINTKKKKWTKTKLFCFHVLTSCCFSLMYQCLCEMNFLETLTASRAVVLRKDRQSAAQGINEQIRNRKRNDRTKLN